MLKIGHIILPDMPLILAPMEDISDPPFRVICREQGADLVYSEFISSEGLIRNADKSRIKLDIFEAERPIAIQVFGHDEDSMREATALIEQAKPDIIDINFGCPVKKVVNKGAGAGALKNPERMIALAKSVVDSTNLPVTVKTRLGWDDKSIQIPEICERLQDVGVKAIALHARTAVQMYGGQADWTWFNKVKDNPRFTIPLFGNGDVKNALDAKRLRDNHPVDGIMIGRATTGNPWIFREIRQYFETGKLPAEVTISDRVEVCKTHLLESVKWKGEKLAILEIRKHYGPYFKGIPNFKPYRMRLVTSMDLKEILDTLEEVKGLRIE
ncbi:tRNA dihydrouridine synthase DusB [Bacteroidota bacterium]